MGPLCQKRSRSDRAVLHLVGCLVAVGVCVMLGVATPSANAQKQTAKIAVSLSLTGANEFEREPRA